MSIPHPSDISGFLLVDKPTGPTSHDIVDVVRRALKTRRVGHAGTLDPFATGLLILAVGKATKEISKFVGLDKTYEAAIRLGATSDTMDRTGVIEAMACGVVGEAAVDGILEKFRGGQLQTPPMYSAKKVGGKKLYELAREGKEIEREPVKITVHELELLSYDWPYLKIRARVSSGTYIRALAHDIGQALGCGAYPEELRRTRVGDFDVTNAVAPERVTLTDPRIRL